MIARFLIFALARTGSTSLMHVLNCHPQIRCLREPFNPTNVDAIKGASDIASLDQTLNKIWTDYNGFKHVWDSTGWPFGTRTELNRQLLRTPQHRILFLNRRNILRRLVSYEMSRQSGVWDATPSERCKMAAFKFQPIDIHWLGSQLRSEHQHINEYRRVITDNGVAYLDLWYEDVFQQAESGRIESLNRIIGFLGGETVNNDRFTLLGNQYLDPVNRQLNSESTYRMIPNSDEIERELGSDDTGRLFEDSAK
jgi:hypothetical protein